MWLNGMQDDGKEAFKRLSVFSKWVHPHNKSLLEREVTKCLQVDEITTNVGYRGDSLFHPLLQIAFFADGDRYVHRSDDDGSGATPTPPNRQTYKNTKEGIRNELAIFYDVSLINFTFELPKKINELLQDDTEKQEYLDRAELMISYDPKFTKPGLSPIVMCDLIQHNWEVYINGVTFRVNDSMTALLASLQACYVFNLCYNSRVRNTMDFLGNILFDVEPQFESEWPKKLKDLRDSLQHTNESLRSTPKKAMPTNFEREWGKNIEEFASQRDAEIERLPQQTHVASSQSSSSSRIPKKPSSRPDPETLPPNKATETPPTSRKRLSSKAALKQQPTITQAMSAKKRSEYE